MELSESGALKLPENIASGIDSSYFDFVNPKVAIDTDVREGEKYQEYVDRMVEAFPTVWQKSLLSYYALTLPIVTLYGNGIHDPNSVEALGIFDRAVLEEEQKKDPLRVNSSSSPEEINIALNGRCVKLMPDYRTKLLSQNALCMYAFSELKRDVEKTETAEFEQMESAKKKKLFNILFGSYGVEEAEHAKYKHLESQRKINGQLNRYLADFKEANSCLTEKEIINYRDIWGTAIGKLQNVTNQVGVPKKVLDNILGLHKTLLNS